MGALSTTYPYPVYSLHLRCVMAVGYDASTCEIIAILPHAHHIH